MLRMAGTITYRDGTTQDISVTQYAVGRWAAHCAARGITYDAKDPGVMAVAQIRYMAYAEIQRDSDIKIAYDAWDRTVDDVEMADSGADDVVPTPLPVSAAQ